jgi:hypothetical protein
MEEHPVTKLSFNTLIERPTLPNEAHESLEPNTLSDLELNVELQIADFPTNKGPIILIALSAINVSIIRPMPFATNEDSMMTLPAELKLDPA